MKIERNFWLLGGSFLAVFAWCLYQALAGNGWALDDELAHFFISRSVWDDPRELLHLWGRPGRNVLEFWPTIFGLKAARVWVLVLAMVAIGLTCLEARRLKIAGVAILPFLPLLIGFQPWFPELASSVLTQTPFMLAWIAGVFFAARGRLVWAAVCWGMLGLIRHEGIALSALWGLWVVCAPDGLFRVLAQRRWSELVGAMARAAYLGFWTFSPHLVLNIASFLVRGEWPFLIYFEEKPTTMYGSGSLFHFVPLLITGAGLPVLVLAMIGVRGVRVTEWKNVLYWTYPAYFVLHSLIFWKGLFASGGYYHFLMPMAPWLGLLALRGFQRLPRTLAHAGLAFVLALGLYLPQQQLRPRDSHIPNMPVKDLQTRLRESRFPARPPLTSAYQEGLREAAGWLDENLAEDQDWLSCHIGVKHFRQQETGRELSEYHYLSLAQKQTLPLRTVFVWDAQYALQEHFNWQVNHLLMSGWVLRASYAHGSVRVFEKMRQLDCGLWAEPGGKEMREKRAE